MAAATKSSCNIRDSFSKIIDGLDFKLKTKRCQNVRESAFKVVNWIYQHQVGAATFSEQLKKELLTIVNEQAKCSFAKRKMWSKYRSFRISENFVKVWSKFLYHEILDVPADNNSTVCHTGLVRDDY